MARPANSPGFVHSRRRNVILARVSSAQCLPISFSLSESLNSHTAVERQFALRYSEIWQFILKYRWRYTDLSFF